MRLALTFPLALATAAALFVAGTASARPAACTAGMTKVKGVQARVFCGPATATVKMGAKTLSFHEGQCSRTSDYITVNIGTIALGPIKAKPNYFGLNVGKLFGSGKAAGHDGAYTGGVVAVAFAGSGYAVRSDTLKVNLSGNRSKGTFSGTLLSGGTVTGSFSC